jgi:hypothetical protein
MKVIFLDIDGVLTTDKQYYMNSQNYRKKNPWANELRVYYPFDKGCVKIFNEILTKTGAEIVLTSDWRRGRSLEQLDTIFKENGVIKSPIDVTCDDLVSISSAAKNRAYQIEFYLKNNKVDKYVVIDDLNIGEFMQFTNDDDKFVLTNDREGLKQLGIKNKILNILNYETVFST